MSEVKNNAKGLKIDGDDLQIQLANKVRSMRNRGLDVTRDTLLNKAGITYSAVLIASRRGTMRIKTIIKLKKIGLDVKITE